MRSCLIAALLIFTGTTATAQPANPDTLKAEPLDFGKMWTFENPPIEYLAETYNFHPDETWFERARLSALRIPGCSASFVSPNGLVITNHHCIRGKVTDVSRPGEDLLDNGFYAASLDEERPILDYYADQLVAIEDVTDEVYAALEGAQTDAERQQARADVFEAIAARLQAARPDEEIEVEVTALYNGGRYSAYVFKRYYDVRLVAAAELQLGFFGGDPDNFTYPRYALDFGFLRVYGEDGRPLSSPNHFTWSEDGVEERDLIFVIGNPGSTSRLATVAQLEFFREVFVPHTLRALENRLEAFRAFNKEDPETGEALDLRNLMFSLSNSQKAYAGRLTALGDPIIQARRQDAEQQFVQALAADAGLQAEYGDVVVEMAELQRQKSELGNEYGAFRLLGNPEFGSATMVRALRAYQYLTQGQSEQARTALQDITDRPASLEERLLAARFSEFQRYLGADDPITQAALQGRSPEEAAEALLAGSVLASAEQTQQAVEAGSLTLEDPAVQIAAAVMPRYADFQSAFSGLSAQEEELSSQLGRARFEVYGTSIPPDATFSPRFTDGIVQGYEYNGTIAPPYTTFYGLYDHYHSYSPDEVDWDLPERWVPAPDALALATPLNFISTADTIGGNSGSPAVTPDLAIVGLNFDRNIEGLLRDYIYLPARARNIMVDVRAIREALDEVYDADRIVQEILTGTLVATEAEADESF